MECASRVPTADRGAAAIIYVNYQDAPSARLVQDRVNLGPFMEGYARKVLLKDRRTPAFLGLGERDEKLADLVLPPTRTHLFAQIVDLAAKGFLIDLFLFCHGWKTCFGGRNDVDAGEDRIDNDAIGASLAPAATGYACMPIRIVWGTDCEGCRRNPAWLGIGARAVSGSKATNFYPDGARNFIDDWNRGDVSFDRAVADADTDVVHTVVQTWLAYVDAPAQKKAGRWSGCSFGKTVLGDDPCAQAYFSACWGLVEGWEDGRTGRGRSGREMMDRSSFKLRGGDTSVTKDSVPRWSSAATRR